MVSHLHGKLAPFDLTDEVVYFHDWRYVFQGSLSWVDSNGKPVPLWGTKPHAPVHCQYQDLPLGVELVAQKANKTEPVVTPVQANEPFMFGGNLLHDDGTYRMWYEGRPLSSLDVEATRAESGEAPQHGYHHNHMRYAESDDGMTWRFPSLELMERECKGPNNLVYGGQLAGKFGYNGGACVFKDEAAPPAERYKMVHRGILSAEEFTRYKRQRPDAIAPNAVKEGRAAALCGATSPDGLHWAPLPEPLLVEYSDTHNVFEYDPVRGKYAGYVRTWFFNRRTIGRTESEEFQRFPLPQELFWPNATVKPYELWYANAKTRMPGTRQYHVMFPMRWSLLEDRFDFHLATSPDGVVWGFVPGGPVCSPGEPGAWDAGIVSPQPGLVELGDGRLAMLYGGAAVPHKHPRRPPLGAVAWAWWPKGRLVALRAGETGSFALWPLMVKGRRVRLNFSTSMTGFLKVEVVGSDGQGVPGRSFQECDVLNGDRLDRLVTWRGEADIGVPEGQPVQLRFQLFRAHLFSVRFA